MATQINPKQLIIAREYREYSQTELATKIKGLSQSNLSKYEKGVDILSEDILLKIFEFLNFPAAFFTRKISNLVDNANYRKRACLNKTNRSKIDITCKLIGYVIDQMADELEYPDFNLRMLDLEEGFSPTYVAQYIRKQLNIEGPVKEIYKTLEKNGIIIVEFDFDSSLFDGVSFISDNGYPIIIVNKNFSNDRKRFSIAHELGHIIMHSAIANLYPEYRNKEAEANIFASEFLMPEVEIKNDLRNLKLTDLAELKRYWLTSMASLIMRAKDLGCISQDRYKYLNIELSRYGYKKKEPVNVYIDSPSIFMAAYKMYRNELGYTKKELAEAFALPIDIIDRLFAESNTPKLRVLI
ncbi:DNA-binding protein [Sanguibacteroides justesenii]|uniref:helix-turn-helix domain-containing protein n=1 Tax=Sanguibacteroides justesenii TaxID=1547597 RepID=UPI000D9622F8|nr:XRE family transcriptional regulator [Sanguibacteroides justesenii]PXZ44929.1 DNA-binding protein [Sanguibacteroides justesenii]